MLLHQYRFKTYINALYVDNINMTMCSMTKKLLSKTIT